MWPVLHFLGLTLPVGPLAALLAFVVGSEVGSRTIRRFAGDGKAAAPWSEAFNSAIFVGLLAGLVAARVAYAMRYFDLYLAEPTLLLSLRPGTLAGWPGIGFGAAVVVFYSRRRQLPLAVIADAGAMGTLAALVIWKLGQFLTGDAYGVPGKVPWAVEIWGEVRHPVQLYVAGALLVGLVLLWWQRRDARPGQLFWQALLVYGAVELFFAAFRANPATWGPGIRTAQVYALLAILTAMYVLSYYARPPHLKGAPKVDESGDDLQRLSPDEI